MSTPVNIYHFCVSASQVFLMSSFWSVLCISSVSDEHHALYSHQ